MESSKRIAAGILIAVYLMAAFVDCSDRAPGTPLAIGWNVAGHSVSRGADSRSIRAPQSPKSEVAHAAGGGTHEHGHRGVSGGVSGRASNGMSHGAKPAASESRHATHRHHQSASQRSPRASTNDFADSSAQPMSMHPEHAMPTTNAGHSGHGGQRVDRPHETTRLTLEAVCLCGCQQSRSQVGGQLSRLGAVVPNVHVARLLETPQRFGFPSTHERFPSRIVLHDPIPI